MLSSSDASILLEIARDAIVHGVNNGDYAPAPREEKALNERSGCFVTIKQHGRLRGCIGNFQSQQPLYREVAQIAVASATQDPRFAPMTAEDLKDFSLEITVLSPLEKILDTDQIEIGRHGIYIEKGFRRGVLLPQVATEQGWDKLTFLQQTCLKAGLPTDAWQAPDAEIYIFSGQIISEKSYPDSYL
ncbi:MAG: AmmeMemoRadiSam system protein A [Desulfuromonadales bacterium]|nr:AmmeMemoRadiSam system protein A [Desulfuromonadales bacterium]MBN2793453.1 AmmeMemoRadiSam system protein A [Desulfuromonadales bacterium]